MDDPLILPEASFRVELGGSTTAAGSYDATKPVLEETQKHSLYYKEHDFGKGSDIFYPSVFLRLWTSVEVEFLNFCACFISGRVGSSISARIACVEMVDRYFCFSGRPTLGGSTFESSTAPHFRKRTRIRLNTDSHPGSFLFLHRSRRVIFLFLPSTLLVFRNSGSNAISSLFLITDHYNFVGGTEATPFVVSLLQHEKPKGSTSYVWKALVRTKSDDLHFEVFAPTRTEALKALQNEITALQGVELFEVKNADIANELQHMEERLLIPSYKFGVVYCKEGQASENDMFSNQSSSKEFSEFMDLMGDKIKLKGWNKYRGGLDVMENTTGTHSYFTSHRNFDVMYHVSTMLPYSAQNMQQLERKRHIGNDVVVIVFQDGSAGGFKPSTITSKFNHVYVVVKVVKDSTKRSSKSKERTAMVKSAPPARKLVNSTTVSVQDGKTEERSASLQSSATKNQVRERSGSAASNGKGVTPGGGHSRQKSNTGDIARKTAKASAAKKDVSSLRSEPGPLPPSMADTPTSSPTKKKRRHMSQEKPVSPQTAAKREQNKRSKSALRVTSPDVSSAVKPSKHSSQKRAGTETSAAKKKSDPSSPTKPVQKAASTPLKQRSEPSSPAKTSKKRTRYRVAVVSKHGVRPFGPVLPRDKIWECNLEFREFLLTKLFNAERAAYYAPGFAQTRTRRLWLMDLLKKYGPTDSK
jgi:hypothetical protein